MFPILSLESGRLIEWLAVQQPTTAIEDKATTLPSPLSHLPRRPTTDTTKNLREGIESEREEVVGKATSREKQELKLNSPPNHSRSNLPENDDKKSHIHIHIDKEYEGGKRGYIVHSDLTQT